MKRTKIRIQDNRPGSRSARVKREQPVKVYDSKAAIPMNAAVAVDTIDAPLHVVGKPELMPATRLDGTMPPRGEELRSAPPPQEQVIRSLRDDPLANMKVRNHIDATQYAAGRALQECFIKAEIGNVKAIEYKEHVDSSGIGEPLTESHRKALQFVNRAKMQLGPQGWLLAADILRDGLHIKDAAAKRGLFRPREVEYLGFRFRECLDTLAVTFGLSNRRQVAVAR